MLEFIHNPIITGIIGVIIGFLSTLLINCINNKHNKDILKLQQNEKNREILLNEKKKAYINFLTLIQKISTYTLATSKNNTSLSKQKSEEILYLTETVKCEVALYYTKEISELAQNIFAICSPTSEEQALAFNEKRKIYMDKILILMKEDLGLD